MLRPALCGAFPGFVRGRCVCAGHRRSSVSRFLHHTLWRQWTSRPTGGEALSVVGDLDGNEKPDLVVEVSGKFALCLGEGCVGSGADHRHHYGDWIVAEPVYPRCAGGASYDPSTSLVVTQTVNAQPANSFQAAVNYAAGATPVSVTISDFNGDGKTDLGAVNILVNDDGDGLLPGLMLNGTGSLGNSQYTVKGPGSSAVVNGNALTVTLNLPFRAGFKGNRIFYLAARDVYEQNNTGWQAMGPGPSGEIQQGSRHIDGRKENRLLSSNSPCFPSVGVT